MDEFLVQFPREFICDQDWIIKNVQYIIEHGENVQQLPVGVIVPDKSNRIWILYLSARGTVSILLLVSGNISMWGFPSLGIPLLELLVKTSIEPFACLLHQDVTKGWGVPVTIIWTMFGLVSSAGVSAAAEPDVGVVCFAIILLVGEDADSDLEVTCLGIETLLVAVSLQRGALQQTLPRFASQRYFIVLTTSDQGMEWICWDFNRLEWPLAFVIHSNAHFIEGSGPVSSEFRLLLVEAIKSSCCVVWFLAFPILWIPPEGILKLIVPISKRSTLKKEPSRYYGPKGSEPNRDGIHALIRD